jgi:hypothetical protein
MSVDMSLKTTCGYDLVDVRKSLREAIGRRDRRATNRWAAELVVTPGAIGSLWSTYWLSCESGADGNPTLPILLSQTWTTLVEKAHASATDWPSFRNDEGVRRAVAEMSCRLLDYPRQPTVALPSKEIALYDVSTMLDKTSPAMADSQIVLSIWSRNHDSMELRQLAGHWIECLTKGDTRIALSIIVWSLLPSTKIKCGPRGPKGPAAAKGSPIWYWFSLGAALLKGSSVHPGWLTFHDVTVEAMTDHYRRWSSVDRLRIMLFWTMQIKASLTSKETWSIKPVEITVGEIDLPYKEIANEILSPAAPVAKMIADPESKESKKSKLDQQMKDADEQILAMLGI